MGFTVRFEGSSWVPAIICDECNRDLGAGEAGGEVSIGRRLNPGTTDPGTPLIARFPLLAPEGFWSAGLATVAIACSDECREVVEGRLLAMTVDETPFERVSLRDYLRALREVLVAR